MYSKNFPDIKLGLVNYIGSSLDSIQLRTSENAKHIVIAMLIEEAINLSKDNEGTINVKDIKPLFKGIDHVTQNRLANLSREFGPETAQVLGKDYINCANSLNKIIENMGGKN